MKNKGQGKAGSLDPLRKKMSENAEPLTEGAQSQTVIVLAALVVHQCHFSLGNNFLRIQTKLLPARYNCSNVVI
jgi:hypothetical protein